MILPKPYRSSKRAPDWRAIVNTAVKIRLPDGTVRFVWRLPAGVDPHSIFQGELAPGVRVSVLGSGDEIAPGVFLLASDGETAQ